MADNNEQRMPAHGEVCWTDVATSDLDGAQEFYSSVFGWKINKSDNPEFDYRIYDDGRGEHSGGMYGMSPEMYGGQTPPPHFVSYIAVDDIEVTCKQIEELGGTILRAPEEIPGTGRMATVTDPQGAMFSIIELYGEK